MKTLGFLSLLLWFSALHAAPVSSGFAPPAAVRPVCGTMNLQQWEVDFQKCTMGLSVGEPVSYRFAQSLCQCMTTELIFKSSCKDLERYTRETPFNHSENARVGEKCFQMGCQNLVRTSALGSEKSAVQEKCRALTRTRSR